MSNNVRDDYAAAKDQMHRAFGDLCAMAVQRGANPEAVKSVGQRFFVGSAKMSEVFWLLRGLTKGLEDVQVADSGPVQDGV